MNTPEKIYAKYRETDSGYCFDVDKQPSEDTVEYIRKDLLLDWLRPSLSKESKAKFDKRWVQGWETMREMMIEKLKNDV